MRRVSRPRSTRRRGQMDHDMAQKAENKVKNFMAVGMTITLVVIIAILVVSVKGYQMIREKGLKNIATEVWEGTNVNDNTTNR